MATESVYSGGGGGGEASLQVSSPPHPPPNPCPLEALYSVQPDRRRQVTGQGLQGNPIGLDWKKATTKSLCKLELSHRPPERHKRAHRLGLLIASELLAWPLLPGRVDFLGPCLSKQ